MLKDNTIAIYIIVDDILQKIDYKEDSQRRVTDALILTTVLVSGWYFGGNWESARCYMLQHHCKNMLDKSRFCRRVHGCRELATWLFNVLGRFAAAMGIERIESSPKIYTGYISSCSLS